VPFINSMTGAALTSFPSRSLRSSSAGCSCATGAGATVSCAGGSEDVDVCSCSAVVRDGGFAPEIRVRIFEFLTRTKKGTAVTSKVSAMSGSSSASIWVVSIADYSGGEEGDLGKCDGGVFEGEFGEDLVHLFAGLSPWSVKIEGDDFCGAGGLEELLKFLECGYFLHCRRRTHLGGDRGG